MHFFPAALHEHLLVAHLDSALQLQQRPSPWVGVLGLNREEALIGWDHALGTVWVGWQSSSLTRLSLTGEVPWVGAAFTLALARVLLLGESVLASWVEPRLALTFLLAVTSCHSPAAGLVVGSVMDFSVMDAVWPSTGSKRPARESCFVAEERRACCV